MRKTIVGALLAFLIFIACRERDGSDSELVSRAKEFVDVLAARQFEKTTDYFDAKMNKGLPPAKIEQAWNMVEAKAGRFQQQLKARQLKEAGFDVVYVTCEFEKSKLNVKVVFDQNRQVSGLWFR